MSSGYALTPQQDGTAPISTVNDLNKYIADEAALASVTAQNQANANIQQNYDAKLAELQSQQQTIQQNYQAADSALKAQSLDLAHISDDLINQQNFLKTAAAQVAQQTMDLNVEKAALKKYLMAAAAIIGYFIYKKKLWRK